MLQRDFEGQGNAGLGQFYIAFNKGLRPEVEASAEEWLQLTARLRRGGAGQ